LLHANQSRPSCLTLGDGLRIAPYADTFTSLCRAWLDPSNDRLHRAQRYKLRTENELLHDTRLAFVADLGLLRSCISHPCVARGLLRAQHFRVLHQTHLAMRSILVAPHRSLMKPFAGLLQRKPLLAATLVSSLRAQIAPRPSLSDRCKWRIAPLLPLMLRAGTSGLA